ncbi:hypothetical protein ACLHDF_14590 [Priestia aryabhattai]
MQWLLAVDWRQGEDSCGKSVSGEKTHRPPRKAKSCTETNSGVTSNPY